MPEFYAASDFAQFHLFRHLPIDGEVNEWRFAIAQLLQHIECGVFQFMLGLEGKIRAQQAEANIKAAEIIGSLYDAFCAEQIYDER
ncbi:type IIL restriction-modification enzyme MmeI [Neisseriaceae bacterium B1]